MAQRGFEDFNQPSLTDYLQSFLSKNLQHQTPEGVKPYFSDPLGMPSNVEAQGAGGWAQGKVGPQMPSSPVGTGGGDWAAGLSGVAQGGGDWAAGNVARSLTPPSSTQAAGKGKPAGLPRPPIDILKSGPTNRFSTLAGGTDNQVEDQGSYDPRLSTEGPAANPHAKRNAILKALGIFGGLGVLGGIAGGKEGAVAGLLGGARGAAGEKLREKQRTEEEAFKSQTQEKTIAAQQALEEQRAQAEMARDKQRSELEHQGEFDLGTIDPKFAGTKVNPAHLTAYLIEKQREQGEAGRQGSAQRFQAGQAEKEMANRLELEKLRGGFGIQEAQMRSPLAMLQGLQPPPVGPGGAVSVTSEADVAKLPSGTLFRTPDGRIKRKP